MRVPPSRSDWLRYSQCLIDCIVYQQIPPLGKHMDLKEFMGIARSAAVQMKKTCSVPFRIAELGGGPLPFNIMQR